MYDISAGEFNVFKEVYTILQRIMHFCQLDQKVLYMTNLTERERFELSETLRNR